VAFSPIGLDRKLVGKEDIYPKIPPKKLKNISLKINI